MANKAPPPSSARKPGRTVKEKRAAKQAKKDAQAKTRKGLVEER
jgi:hypothetical protein